MGFRKILKYVQKLGKYEMEFRGRKITLKEYIDNSLEVIEEIEKDDSIPPNVKDKITIQKNKLNVLKSQLDDEKEGGENER